MDLHRYREDLYGMKLHIREYYLNITFIFLLSIFALFVVYYYPLAYAQVNITSSQTLSNTPGNSTDPKIALDNNNVHVVWSDDSTGNGDIYFKRSVDNGTTFGSLENLSNTPGNSTDPKIGLHNNNVYVVWSDDSTGNGDIYFKRSVDNGTTFDSTNNISKNNTGTSSTPQVAANAGNVYIIWTARTSGTSEINYRQSVDRGAKFAGIRELSKTRSIDGESARFPQIVTAGNNVYVAWQDTVQGGNEIRSE